MLVTACRPDKIGEAGRFPLRNPNARYAFDEFLDRETAPKEAKVREMLSAHLCRCTGHTNIVNAVVGVATDRQRMSGG